MTVASSTGRRAVVLGGGVAGLLSALVLAEHGPVTVVDRDDLDGDLDAPRRGTPQSAHTHALLVAGVDALEDLVPGFTAALVARGARHVDPLERVRWLVSGHVQVRATSGRRWLLASRTLVEAELRRRARTTDGVRLLGSHDIVGPRLDGGRVVGVAVVDRRPGAAPDGTFLPADLVVDATGRGSRAPAWLRDAGYDEPPETTVDARIVYVTRTFRDRPGLLDDVDGDAVGLRTGSRNGGLALRREGGLWTVTLIGDPDDEPPLDLDGFRAFARRLPTPGVAEVATVLEPVGGPVRITFPASRWRHWERLRRRPAGLVVVGDAVATLNPAAGMGMTLSALQLLRLRDLLRRNGSDLEAAAAAAFADVVRDAWTIGTDVDAEHFATGPLPLADRVLGRYLDRLLAVATQDVTVARAFSDVVQLRSRPASLLAPALAWRAVRPGTREVVRRAVRAREAREPATGAVR